MRSGEWPFVADRRHVVQGGAAITLSTIASWLFANSTPLKAQTISGKAPEIDDLTVTVLVDSYQVAVGQDSKIGNLAIKPPTERTEPKGSAMKERETLCERVAALDVGDFVSHYGIKLGIVPISPGGGKQNGGAADSECDGHENDFGLGEARQFLEPGCARMSP